MMMRNGGDGDGDGDGDEAGLGNVNGDESLKKFDFPEGYKFKPTDEEVIKYYLLPKINKIQLPPNSFNTVNIYAFTPWDLSERYKSYGDNECYFFTPRERKYQKGKRPNRAANGGYWKPVMNNIPIIDEVTNNEIGYKRDLIFYLGKPSKGDHSQIKEMYRKTDWRMHEYTLKQKPKEKEEKNKPSSNMQLDEFVVCKLYFKQRKSTSVDNDVDVDVDIPPSIDIPTTSTAPAPVPENQYPITSASVAEEMVPENHLYKCQTDVAAAAEYRYPLTSMVAAAVPEEMISFDDNYNYLDNVNPSSSSSAILHSVNHQYYNNGNGEMNQQQLQEEEILQEDGIGEMNQEQLQLHEEILQQLHGEVLQKQEEYEWNLIVTEMNNIGSHPTSMVQQASPPDLTEIGPR